MSGLLGFQEDVKSQEVLERMRTGGLKCWGRASGVNGVIGEEGPRGVWAQLKDSVGRL
jgi:hypothetical protein